MRRPPRHHRSPAPSPSRETSPDTPPIGPVAQPSPPAAVGSATSRRLSLPPPATPSEGRPNQRQSRRSGSACIRCRDRSTARYATETRSLATPLFQPPRAGRDGLGERLTACLVLRVLLLRTSLQLPLEPTDLGLVFHPL